MYIAKENWRVAYLVDSMTEAKRVLDSIGIRHKNRESYYIRDIGKHFIRIIGSYNDVELFKLRMKQIDPDCKQVFEECEIKEKD